LTMKNTAEVNRTNAHTTSDSGDSDVTKATQM
jgi:hypothetical protein